LEEKEILEKKNHTSFGKLILAKERSSPVYSKLLNNFKIGFGQAERSLDFILQKSTPGPEYNMTDRFKYKKVNFKYIHIYPRLLIGK
jgi:hypothetical protein